MTPELFAALAELQTRFESELWVAVMVFLRVGAISSLLPVFGEGLVPVRVRLAAALALTLVVLPLIGPDLAGLPEAPGALIARGAAEIVAGLVLGLMLRLLVIGLQIAGTIAAQSTSLSQLFGGSAGTDPAPAIGHVLILGGLALATLGGLHVRCASYIVEGYVLIPPGTLPLPAVIAEAGTAQVARVFALGFTLAAPFVVASLIYNVTLGVINRAMPQLMVAFVGAPAITAGALALLWLTAPLLLPIWREALWGFMDAPFGVTP